MNPIKVGTAKGPVHKSSSVAGSRYYTEDYSRNLLALLTKWKDGGMKPMLISSDETGMEPNALRVSLYTARAYVREHPALFPEGSRKLVDSASFELAEKPRGLILRRRSAAFELVTLAMEVSRDKQDDEGYQAIMSWISDPRELNDKYEVAGPFNVHDYNRLRDLVSKLQGIYIASLTPQKFTLIFHPGGK